MLLGSGLLLATAWSVAEVPPGSATSGWALAFLVIGLLYAGIVPALMDLQLPGLPAGRYLSLRAAFHWLPFAGVTAGTVAWLQGSAYGFRVPWCWATWLASARLTLAIALWRWRRPGQA